MNQFEIVRLTPREAFYYETYSQHRDFLKEMAFVEEEENFIEKINSTCNKSNFIIAVFDNREFNKQEITFEMEDDLEELKDQRIIKYINKKMVGLAEYEYKGKYPFVELKREYYSIHKNYQGMGISKLLRKENKKILDKWIKEEIKRGNDKASIYFPPLYEFSSKGSLRTKTDTFNDILDLTDKYKHLRDIMTFKHYTVKEIEDELDLIKKTKEYLNDCLFYGDKTVYKDFVELGLNKNSKQENYLPEDLSDDLEEEIKLNIKKIIEKEPDIANGNFLIHFNTIEYYNKEYKLNKENLYVEDEFTLKDYLVVYKNGDYLIHESEKNIEVEKGHIVLDINFLRDNNILLIEDIDRGDSNIRKIFDVFVDLTFKEKHWLYSEIDLEKENGINLGLNRD